MVRRNPRWFVWWYATIAVGFLLLAINRAIAGEKPWLIGVRLVIAAGFAFLAWLEHRTARRDD
jgi:hypothetical protein